MNDFVACLVAALAFCIGFVVLGFAIRLVRHLDVGPLHLGEGSLLHVALAGAIAAAAWHRGFRRRQDPA